MGVKRQPGATDRLFFALRPDAAAAAQADAIAQQLVQQHGLHGKPLGVARYHVTLAFLGDHAGLADDLLDQATAVGDALAQPAFDVVLDEVRSFARGQGVPLVLCGRGAGVAGLERLAEGLRAGLEPFGLAERRTYRAHLTLLRDVRALAPQAVPPLAWRATEFVLVRSLIGQARHEVLRRWPLAEPGA